MLNHMVNIGQIDVQERMKQAFEAGYSNAAMAFTQMMQDRVEFAGWQSSVLRTDTDIVLDSPLSDTDNVFTLITTEIFGDVLGKSYLLLSEVDMQLLTARIAGVDEKSAILREEFIKEVDNILSAAVISRLSDQLRLTMYGDVPVLNGQVRGNVATLITDDFSERTDQIYINAGAFSFEMHPDVCPSFIWVVEGEILHTLQAHIGR